MTDSIFRAESNALDVVALLIFLGSGSMHKNVSSDVVDSEDVIEFDDVAESDDIVESRLSVGTGRKKKIPSLR